MKVCLVQHDIEWQNPTENILRMDALFQHVPKADLYVLTEMWATGFGDVPILSDKAQRWMLRTAQAHDAAIAGSLAVKEQDRVYNRLLFVTPDGKVEHYDKRHLFAPGGEKDHYTSGQVRKVVEWRGVRLLLQLCYDLRFPVFSRNLDDYDAAIYVANWPKSRQRVWDTLLRARAIENQCYVVGVNRVGTDPSLEYDGGSVIIDAYGRTVADCGTQEGYAVAILNMESLQAFREKFPVLKDRDKFTMKD